MATVLILSVCLLANPKECKNVELTYTDIDLTPMQCLMGAQPEIAKWMESHPKWTTKKWKCADSTTFKQDI